MQDAIALGTGNSRYLKSVSGFKELYPTYDDFVQALVDGTLPIDLNGINPDGWAQTGMELNKANLLTDATAALVDLGSDATPNDVLAVLANQGQTISNSNNELSNNVSSVTRSVDQLNTKVIQLSANVTGLITYGTSDLTAGSSKLSTGSIYLMYE